jgi:hypothetical protein
VDLLEVARGALHLLIDGPEVLGPPAHQGVHLGLLHGPPQPLAHFIYIGGPALGRAGHLGGQGAEVLRLEVLEAEVLELHLHPLDAQPVGHRRVDLPGLPGDPLLLLARHVLERPHVVHAVGQLDEDDPDVAGHRQEHLAEVLRLPLLPGVPGDLAELGDPVDQHLDLLPEQPADVLGGGAGVLDAVMEQTGADRGDVQPQIGDDLGDAERVDDVRLARPPELSGVAFGRELVAAPDETGVGACVVALDRLADCLGFVHSGGHSVRAAASSSSAWARASLRKRAQRAAI